MKALRIFQFVAAAMLFSIGCGILLTKASLGFAVLCFCLSPFMLPRTKLNRPMPAWILWLTVGISAGLVVYLITANHFYPRPDFAHFLHEPLVIGALWLAQMAMLVWRSGVASRD